MHAYSKEELRAEMDHLQAKIDKLNVDCSLDLQIRACKGFTQSEENELETKLVKLAEYNNQMQTLMQAFFT